MDEGKREGEMGEGGLNEREMWIAIRAALLAMADAIARRYELDKYAPPKVVRAGPGDSVATTNG